MHWLPFLSGVNKTLKAHNIPRSKMVIMTKCFRPVIDPEIDDTGSCAAFSLDLARQSKDYVNHCGEHSLDMYLSQLLLSQKGLSREEEREMLKYCNHAGIGLIPVGLHISDPAADVMLTSFKWSPLASGRLARPPGYQPKGLQS